MLDPGEFPSSRTAQACARGLALHAGAMLRRSFLAALCAGACTHPAPAGPSADAPFAAEIAAFLAADRAARPGACQYLFVGSSSIRMWATLAEDMAPLPVINRGFGGSTIADVNAYFDLIVAPYLPRAIIFYAGENDIDAGASPADVAGRFAAFMGLKRRALGDTPVYFVSLKPSRLRAMQFERQSEANALIAAMADEAEDLVFIDVVPAMLEAGGERLLFIEDGLHLNAEGYAVWREGIRAALAAPAPTRAPRC